MSAPSTFRQALLVAACGAATLLASPDSMALSNYLSAFATRYPNTTTDDARCLVCHGVSSSGNADTGTWNRYGEAIIAVGGTIDARLAAVEGADSDGEGHSNLAEINANAQPGWCATGKTGCNNNGFTPPSSIALLDPAPANQAPTADPGGPYSATAGSPVTLNGAGSSDPDGSIASYAWDFGNGSLGSGVSPSVTYSTAGSYTVALTVTDDLGATSSPATTSVTVSAGQQPPVADAGGPYSGSVGVPVDFSGTGSQDPDGTIVSYSWNFGDGNSGSGPSPSHAYAAAGSYAVTLTVTDNDNLTDSASATASVSDGSGMQPPVADPGGPYAGTTGLSMQFDGTGSTDPDGSIVSYAWDFGDGNGGSGATPSYAYAAPGSYTVTLTVTDDSGKTGSASTVAAINDSVNRTPTADAGGPYEGAPGEMLSFDGSASSDPDGSILAWAWDFGDGNVGSGSTPTHAYAVAGNYTVTLVVTDDSGADSAPTTSPATIRETSAAAASGEALYATNCADCHGGPWDGPAQDSSLAATKRVAGARVCTIEGAIFGTSVFPGGVPDMVAYGNQALTTEDITAIADFLDSREATGEQRYVTACAGCHGADATGGRVSEYVKGEDAGDIREAIREEAGMGYLACLPSADVDAIGAFLTKDDRCRHENDCDGDGRDDEVDRDDDDDGMPDDYEESKGFNPHDSRDAKQDADGDGATNLAEFKAGTDPLNPSSKPEPQSGGIGGTDLVSLTGLVAMLLAGARRRTVRVHARLPS